MVNSLQAALDKKKIEVDSDIEIKSSKKTSKPRAKTKVSEQKQEARQSKSRENTVLIGGHFPKEVVKQLRFIAVEEETSNQELLREALDLLFVKKGKLRIHEITNV